MPKGNGKKRKNREEQDLADLVFGGGSLTAGNAKTKKSKAKTAKASKSKIDVPPLAPQPPQPDPA